VKRIKAFSTFQGKDGTDSGGGQTERVILLLEVARQCTYNYKKNRNTLQQRHLLFCLIMRAYRVSGS
jgi:hypothetical protein